MHAGDAGFVSLADALRPRAISVEREALVAEREAPAAAAALSGSANGVEAAAGSALPPERCTPEQAAAIRAARLFHAALGDALVATLTDLLREIAAEVVVRELRLAPIDISGIARRLLAERLSEEPVQLRVAPADAGIVCDLPVIADAALEPGDAILECRSGSIDARLGVRLAAVLEAVRR